MGGGVSRFSVENFLCRSAKNFIGEPFSVSLNSGIEKLYASDAYVTIFRRKNFVSQYRNISKKNRSVLCFNKFPVAKSFWIRRGEHQDPPSDFFCVAMPKNFIG